MDEDLENTVRHPPRHLAPPPPSGEDLEDTVIPERPVPRYPLVEPTAPVPMRATVPAPAPVPAPVPVPVPAPVPVRTPDPRELVDTGPIPIARAWADTEHFRIRLSGQVHLLDAVAYIGRRPSSPRIISGAMPRLIRVESPAHEVSGTHIEARQVGEAVVLTDMWSTNGSVIRPPGSIARKLRQGESVVAPPGTLVDIGDGNVIEVLLPFQPDDWDDDGAETHSESIHPVDDHAHLLRGKAFSDPDRR